MRESCLWTETAPPLTLALPSYLGNIMGQVIAGSARVPDLGTESFRSLPFYGGVPWFLPLVGGYYRIRDWLS